MPGILAFDVASFLEDAAMRPRLCVDTRDPGDGTFHVGATCGRCSKRWALPPMTPDEAHWAGARQLASDLATLVCDDPCGCTAAHLAAPRRDFR